MRKTPTIQLPDHTLLYLENHHEVTLIERPNFDDNSGSRQWGHYTSTLDDSQHAYRDPEHLTFLLNHHFKACVGRQYKVLEDAYIADYESTTLKYCNMTDHRNRPRRVRYAINVKHLAERAFIKITKADDMPLWASRYTIQLTNWNVWRADNLTILDIQRSGITSEGFIPSWWNVWTDENHYVRKRFLETLDITSNDLVVIYYFNKVNQ